MNFPFICADTEDNSKELLEAGRSGFDKELTQVAAITAEGKRWWGAGARSGKHFLAWLRRQPERICYFHNLQYDLGNLFGNELDQLDVCLVGGRMISAVWALGRAIEPITFFDTFNIWPMSVAKIAPAFGLEKLAFNATDRDYVFRDCEIIRQAMLFYWRLAVELGIGKVAPTIGGFAVKTWQGWGGKNSHDSNELSRQALYGGRVELFAQRNACLVCHCDINSLYPFVMLNEFPDLLKPWPRGRFNLPPYGVAEVTIDIPECNIAPLPWRDPEDGRIFYPWGRVRGVWIVPEILNAMEHGARLIKVHKAIGSRTGSRPYADWVNRLYWRKAENRSAGEREFFKRLLCNLWGRLSTTGHITKSVWQTPKNKFDGVPYGDKVLVTYPMPLAEETNWCHAAYVTGYGRLELQRYLRRVGAEKMIYCDTDSVIFNCPDALRLGDLGSLALPPWYFGTGPELGEMKLEGWHDHAFCWAPKTYNAGKYWKAKGVPVRLAREFIERGRVCYDMPFRFREACAFFDRANIKKLSVWRQVEKMMVTAYDRKALVGGRFYPRKLGLTGGAGSGKVND